MSAEKELQPKFLENTTPHSHKLTHTHTNTHEHTQTQSPKHSHTHTNTITLTLTHITNQELLEDATLWHH